MAAVAATAVVVKQGRQQFGSLFNEIFAVTASLNPDDAADGANVLDTVAVPGVALGDIVICQSHSLDRAGLTVTGYVSAANAVIVNVQNETGGAVNMGAFTLKMLIGRPGW